MLTTIAAIVVLLLAAVLIYAAMQPNGFRVERTASIGAPPEKIFALLNDYRGWASWSPYEKLDPAMKRTLSGAESGKGSVYEWEGNGNVGKGRMEIIDTAPPSKVTIKLDMLKPVAAHNIAEFTLAPKGASTDVTWAMHGPSPFVGKLMGVVFNMDRMVGGQFAEGLANLKAVCEK